jgi:hypothetical protein
MSLLDLALPGRKISSFFGLWCAAMTIDEVLPS